MTPAITLLTDFGDQDGYVGVMKGVIVGICPTVRILDLTHAVPPQNIAAARFTLLQTYRYFPPGTIHTVVVDPGVGTARRAIAVQTATGYFVGPDNGVLSGVLEEEEAIAAVALTCPAYWRTPQPSPTFHGRDIFAPVAAHLAAGVPLAALGPAIAPAGLLRLTLPTPQITDTLMIGHVQHVDYFGNLITTLKGDRLAARSWQLQVGQITMPVGQTYGDVPIGHAIAIVGSHGWVEIAVNGSSAQARLRLRVGDEIRLWAAGEAIAPTA